MLYFSTYYYRTNAVMAALVAILMHLLVPALLLMRVVAVVAAGAPPFSCGGGGPSLGLPFCNTKLPAAQRAADLVSRMTPAEKASQLGDVANGVPRLGVPSYKWWNEALHGVAISGKGIHMDRGAVRSATSFPQVLLTAASFNDNLWFRIGQVRHVCVTWAYNIWRTHHAFQTIQLLLYMGRPDI